MKKVNFCFINSIVYPRGSTLIILFLFSFGFAFAEDLFIKQFPDSPKEGETVKMTLQSEKYDLNIANIDWSIDGESVDNGVGRKTLEVKTKTNGGGQIIVVRVSQAGFEDSSVQRVLEANTNFILYEGADSYVPPFYKGRRLPSQEGTIRTSLFSFKNGEIVGANNTETNNYSWEINEQERKEYSGSNKILNNILTKVTDNKLNIKVIKNESSGGVKTTKIDIPLQKTDLVLYKSDEKKLIKQYLTDTHVGKKLYVLVEPFFFSANSKKNSNLIYNWKINNIDTKINSPWFAVFTGTEKDTVKVNLSVINNDKITQDASKGFIFKVE